MLPLLIPALIAGGATLISSLIGASASKDAAQTQADAAQAGIDEQKAAREEMRKLLDPYVQAGGSALSAQSDLLGLNGDEARKAAIAGIAGGSEMEALTKQGEDAILQNAAATGGLRGGNLQGALAQFRPQMLTNLINQQYSRLGGITQLGQASAAGVGAAGMSSAAQIAELLKEQGAANAGGDLATGQAWASLPNSLLSGLGMYTGMGGTF